VRRVRDHLDGDIAADPGLDDLAVLAGLNRAHLVRVFRRATGTTPHAYLIDRRVRAARRLLARGEAPAEVAAACGFCDQSHLNRAFKARLAVTPGLYRA
jgi:AraC-like DNA-binding protein